MPTEPLVPQAAHKEARNKTPTFRATEDEDERIKAAARASGHPAAVFIRLAVMAAVEQVEAAAKARKPTKKGGR